MLLFSWPESRENCHLGSLTLVLKQFTVLDSLSHLSVLQNLSKILIDSKSEEYSDRWIFVLGIVFWSLVKIKCLYSIQSIFSMYVVAVWLLLYHLPHFFYPLLFWTSNLNKRKWNKCYILDYNSVVMSWPLKSDGTKSLQMTFPVRDEHQLYSLDMDFKPQRCSNLWV